MRGNIPNWLLTVALAGGGAALGMAGSQLLRPSSAAATAELADALVKLSMLGGPVVATGMAAAAAIAASVIVPAVVVYALCKWGNEPGRKS